MTYTRDDYRIAKAAADDAWRKYKATPEAAAWIAASERLDEIEDALSDCVTCEGCGEPIFDGDPRNYNSEDGIYLCVDCAPTWQDLLDQPEDFYNFAASEAQGEIVYHTKETAKPIVDRHLASGGHLSDSLAH